MLPWTVDDTLDLVRDHDADFSPGAEVVYSDSNYVLLGTILEQVTGRPIGEVIEERILEPLGAHRDRASQLTTNPASQRRPPSGTCRRARALNRAATFAR